MLLWQPIMLALPVSDSIDRISWLKSKSVSLYSFNPRVEHQARMSWVQKNKQKGDSQGKDPINTSLKIAANRPSSKIDNKKNRVKNMLSVPIKLRSAITRIISPIWAKKFPAQLLCYPMLTNSTDTLTIQWYWSRPLSWKTFCYFVGLWRKLNQMDLVIWRREADQRQECRSERTVSSHSIRRYLHGRSTLLIQHRGFGHMHLEP